MNVRNYDHNARDLIEQQLLATIMWLSANNSFREIQNLITVTHGIDDPEYFYSILNKNVFISMLKCWENEMPATIEMVTTFRSPDYFERDKWSQFDIHVLTISTKWVAPSNLDSVAFVLKQFILMDYWNNKAYDILGNDWSIRDVLEVSDNIKTSYDLLFEKMTKHFRKGGSTGISPKERMQKERERVLSGDIIWIPSGIQPVDRDWKGFWNGDVTIIAARPSMGKSALMIACAMHAVFEYGKKVGFFSLEMDKVRLMNHIISARTGINYDRIKAHNYSDEEFQKIMMWYDWFEKPDCPFKIYDIHDCQTLDEITSNIPGHEAVFIDYLQLTKLKRTNAKNTALREQDVAEISRGFKIAALENQIPLMAGAQLNRKVDERPKHMPFLSDLRESGSIEQDADNVWFPMRPAYYEKMNNPDAIIPEWAKGNFTMSIAKSRDGLTDVVKFHMNLTTYKFTDGHLTASPYNS